MIPGWMGQGPPPGYAMAEDNSMVPNSFYGGGGGAAPADPIQQLIAVLMRQAQMPAASGSQIKPSLLTGPFLQYLMQNGLMGGGGGAGGGIGGGGSGRLTPY